MSYQACHSNVLTNKPKTLISKKATAPIQPVAVAAGHAGYKKHEHKLQEKPHLEQAAGQMAGREAKQCRRACSAATPGPQHEPNHRLKHTQPSYEAKQDQSINNSLTRLQRLRLTAERGPL
jgi:hypothetical protein